MLISAPPEDERLKRPVSSNVKLLRRYLLKKSLEERIEEAIGEEISIVPYDLGWRKLFQDEGLSVEFYRKAV